MSEVTSSDGKLRSGIFLSEISLGITKDKNETTSFLSISRIL
ncbi:hypothetical protein [Empedobacter brevis]|nr:hypothetical protein [Empedobacter brevis]